MKVTLLGTSAGIPIPGRAQSGVLIETSSKKILLDCGMAVPLRIAEAGVSVKEIDIICLTHEHLDHVQDLPALGKGSWLDSKEVDYKLVVPPGLKEHLVRFWKRVDRSLFEDEKTSLIFETITSRQRFDDDLSIEPFETRHTEMSQGYKIFHEDKKVIYTSDTEACEKIKEVSDNADLLIHEMSSLKNTQGHTDPEALISKMKGSSVEKLVLTHFYPQAAEASKEVADKVEKKIGVETISGKDLKTFHIGS